MNSTLDKTVIKKKKPTKMRILVQTTRGKIESIFFSFLYNNSTVSILKCIV